MLALLIVHIIHFHSVTHLVFAICILGASLIIHYIADCRIRISRR